VNLLLDDIRAYLIAQAAIPSGWGFYSGYIPDDQDRTVALFETGGYPSETLGRENERVTFQTRVRAGRLDYLVCHQVWKDIYDALRDSTPAAGYYLVQSMHAGPQVFNDDRGRTNMTSNWKVLRAKG